MWINQYYTFVLTLVAEPWFDWAGACEMSGQNEDVNVRLPTWAGDWLGFQNYELRVSLEIDSTKEDDLTMLGPQLANKLTWKALAASQNWIEIASRPKMGQNT